jgi:hypothetical protein
MYTLLDNSKPMGRSLAPLNMRLLNSLEYNMEGSIHIQDYKYNFDLVHIK